MLQHHAIEGRDPDHGFGSKALDRIEIGIQIDTGLKD